MDQTLDALDRRFACFLETNDFRGRRLALRDLPEATTGGRGTVAYDCFGVAMIAMCDVIRGHDRDWFTLHLGGMRPAEIAANTPSGRLLDGLPRFHRHLEESGFARIEAASMPRMGLLIVQCVHEGAGFGVLIAFAREEPAMLPF